MITRRGFLAGILAANLAPAAVSSGILMPVKKVWVPNFRIQGGFDGIDDWMRVESPIGVGLEHSTLPRLSARYWYDPSDLSTVFRADGAPASIGDEVSYILDKGGSGMRTLYEGPNLLTRDCIGRIHVAFRRAP